MTCGSMARFASNSQLTVVANAPSGHGVGPLVLLPNGSVFVGGGSVFGNDVVNLATDQWTNIAPPPCTSSKQSCESAGVLLSTGGRRWHHGECSAVSYRGDERISRTSRPFEPDLGKHRKHEQIAHR